MSQYRVGTDLNYLNKRLVTNDQIINFVCWILANLALIGLMLLFGFMQGQAPIVDGHL